MDGLCFALFLNTPNSSWPLLRFQVSASRLSPPRGLCPKKAPTLPTLPCPSLQPDGGSVLETSGLNKRVKGVSHLGQRARGLPSRPCPPASAAMTSWPAREGFFQRPVGPRSEGGKSPGPCPPSLPPSRPQLGPGHFSINTHLLGYSFSWISLLPEAS